MYMYLIVHFITVFARFDVRLLGIIFNLLSEDKFSLYTLNRQIYINDSSDNQIECIEIYVKFISFLKLKSRLNYQGLN